MGCPLSSISHGNYSFDNNAIYQSVWCMDMDPFYEHELTQYHESVDSRLDALFTQVLITVIFVSCDIFYRCLRLIKVAALSQHHSNMHEHWITDRLFYFSTCCRCKFAKQFLHTAYFTLFFFNHSLKSSALCTSRWVVFSKIPQIR